MEDIELKNLWKSYDQKLEEARILNLQSWALNLKSFETMQTFKAKNKLRSLRYAKLAMMFAGIVWVGILVYLIPHSLTYQKMFFVISVALIALFSILAIIIYIRHLVLIWEIDNSESIVDTQKKLSVLQTSTLNTVRILWLQMPFYTTFFWSPAFFRDIKSWLIAIPITLLFTFFSIWLFKNINFKNSNKKWFRLLMSGPEWDNVNKAIYFINEIEEFKQNI